VEFTWVKAHSGILLNECADQLATRGASGGSYGPNIPATDVRAYEPENAEEFVMDDPNVTQWEDSVDPEHWCGRLTRPHLLNGGGYESRNVMMALVSSGEMEELGFEPHQYISMPQGKEMIKMRKNKAHSVECRPFDEKVDVQFVKMTMLAIRQAQEMMERGGSEKDNRTMNKGIQEGKPHDEQRDSGDW
jgi:hypothetical protein